VSGIGMRTAGGTALRVTGLSKTFPGTRALRAVSLEVRRGDIHALVGGNGSGKSTLVKILAGVHAGDAGGTIEVGALQRRSDHWSPPSARAAGVRVVHQDVAVFDDLTVAENLALGRGFETTRAGRIRWRSLHQRAAAVLRRFHIGAAPDTAAHALRPSDRTMLAIARALQDQEVGHDAVLVLDEPTAALPEADAERLLSALRRYAAAGQTIVLVSHRLDEVLAVADRASVMRDGAVVATLDADELTEERLVELIAGRVRKPVRPTSGSRRAGQAILQVRDLAGGPVAAAGFELRAGEVLGLAGLAGAGGPELLRMLFGAHAVDAGHVTLEGRPVRFRTPHEAVGAGVAYVSARRSAEGAFPALSVRENLSAAGIREYWRGLHLRRREERADAVRSIEAFSIRTSSDERPMATLSGGNQQKVVLARWLQRRPRLLLLDEPTQAVDVTARAEIHAHIRAAADQGTAILVVSSDFEELALLSDRALVLDRGRIVAELRRPHLDRHRLTALAHQTMENAT
jgi:ribose transport system ATP-binding protein